MGLALADPSIASLRFMRASAATTGSSNLRTVDSAGQTSEALANGQATISKFLIAPNDKLYVLFQQKTNLQDSTTYQNGCLLAEVNTSTGIPTCIDDELDSVSWNDGAVFNQPIQFDGSGAIYYHGTKGSNRILRKYSSGVLTDLINDNVDVRDFLVLNDGSLFFSGRTLSNNSAWFRRLTSLGSLQTIIGGANQTPSFFRLFPDSKLYFGNWDGDYFGVYSMATTGTTIDSNPWIGNGSYGGSNPVNYCTGGSTPALESFCGSFVNRFHRTPTGKVFAIVNAPNGKLVEYYPSIVQETLTVTKVSLMQGVLTNLILAGLNASNKNILTLFDTTGSSETLLIGSDNEIEIYHLNFVASTNKIMFDGLRFSDNKYVIGQVDLNTMQVSASQTGSTKLVDFQTF